MTAPETVETLRSVRAIAHAPRVPRAPGFDVAFLRPEPIGGGMDPFLQVDAFALAEPVFAPHPHAGFNAVTYIFPESPIGFVNRDSLGTRNRIGPGALHWTMAGSGILHEEVPEHRGIAAVGLQIFVNLPAKLKHAQPRALHLEPEQIPHAVVNGTTIRAVIGSSNGISSPVNVPTSGVRLIDVAIAPGGFFEQDLSESENAFVWLFSGSAIALTGGGAHRLRTYDLLGYQRDGARIRIQGGLEGTRLVLFAGPPIDEPIAVRGPFVMTTEGELDRAFHHYRAGSMGTLAASTYDRQGHPIAPDV